jgi:hypothetical protein
MKGPHDFRATLRVLHRRPERDKPREIQAEEMSEVDTLSEAPRAQRPA